MIPIVEKRNGTRSLPRYSRIYEIRDDQSDRRKKNDHAERARKYPERNTPELFNKRFRFSHYLLPPFYIFRPSLSDKKYYKRKRLSVKVSRLFALK